MFLETLTDIGGHANVVAAISAEARTSSSLMSQKGQITRSLDFDLFVAAEQQVKCNLCLLYEQL